MRRAATFLLFGLVACAAQLPEKVELESQAEAVEFAYEAPSTAAYKFVGDVVGVGISKDAEEAQNSARNDLRNKAAALGAALVTVDENTAEAVLLLGKTKVKLAGRAYKPVD
jgi:hypothetical protein